MKPIKNEETENFCQRSAKAYKRGYKELATRLFIKFVYDNPKLVRWEILTIKSRIQYLINN